MSRSRLLLAVGTATLLAFAVPAHGDPVKCQKTVIKGLAKYKKTYLKVDRKCLDAENLGEITPAVAQLLAELASRGIAIHDAGSLTATW